MTTTPDKIAEVEASNGRKELWHTANGSEVREVAPEKLESRIESRAQELAKSQIGDAKLSRAQARLAEMRSTTTATPRLRLEIAGHVFWIRKLGIEGVTRVGLLSSRDGSGVLMVAHVGTFTSLMAAILFVCVAAEETGEEQFFESWDEAYGWASDNDDVIIGVNEQIFAAATALNPAILPEPDEEPVANSEGKDDPLVPAPDSPA